FPQELPEDRNGHSRKFADVLPAHRDRQALPAEAGPVAGEAGAESHVVLLDLPAHTLRIGLPVAPGQIIYDPLKTRLLPPFLAVFTPVNNGDLLSLRSVKDHLNLLRTCFP